MKLIPLLIHDCPWGAVRWLRALNIVPDKATPLDTMSEQEQKTFLARMTEDIAKFLETWQERTEAEVAEAPITTTLDISHLPETSAVLFGRDAELDALDVGWESPETSVVAFVAGGGVGKSALVNRWLREGAALDLLRTQGLFDRPAPSDQVTAALDVETIDTNAIDRLRDLHLLAPHSRHAPNVLEAHPLIREHYQEQFREKYPDRFREAHRRLYEHLTKTTKDKPDTLAGLQPLYQAVRHGCLAGMQSEARRDVYHDRIMRGDEVYSTSKLGAIGADIQLYRARFFQDREALKESSRLIEETGYHRRDEELADVQAAAKKWVRA
jgi:hypothetical protein